MIDLRVLTNTRRLAEGFAPPDQEVEVRPTRMTEYRRTPWPVRLMGWLCALAGVYIASRVFWGL